MRFYPFAPSFRPSHSQSTKKMAVTSAPPPPPRLLRTNPSIPCPRTRHFRRCQSIPSSPGLIFKPGSNVRTFGFPVVKRHFNDETERWLMWYNVGDAIGLATSNNGVHWEETAGEEAIRPSDDWWVFDNSRVTPSDVLIMSSDKLRLGSAVYWMYYTGFTEERLEVSSGVDGVVSKSLPGLAISQDGQHWARIEGEHHTGALFDEGEDEDQDWGSLLIAGPKVVYHGNKDLRMYYHSIDINSGGYAIGIARSMDGLKWAKSARVLERGPAGSFDEAGVRNGHVVRNENDGGYLMVYEGISSDGRASIGLAESADGLKNWRRRTTSQPLLAGCSDEQGWDCNGVSAPCLVQLGKGEGWRLYYTGVGKERREGIGLAVCDGSEPTDFVKWKSFQI